MLARLSTVAGERGGADAERDIRGTALKFYTKRRVTGTCRQQHAGVFLSAIRCGSRTSPCIKRDPRTGCAARITTGISGRCCRSVAPGHDRHVDRGIPKSFRHMHLFGSHTFADDQCRQ